MNEMVINAMIIDRLRDFLLRAPRLEASHAIEASGSGIGL